MSETELQFERFWKFKPKREGADSKKEARLKFLRHVANGVNPEKIISAAQQWAEEVSRLGTEPRFVPMAVTWLNQQRFNMYPDREVKSEATLPDRIFSKAFNAWFFWNGEKYVMEAT